MAPKRRDKDTGEAAKRRRILKEFILPSSQLGYCFTFGTNGFGALGLGEDVLEKYRAAHVDVDGKKLLSVVCGGMHTVALAEDGSVYTWGVNDEGALGRPTSGTAWEAEPDNSKEDPYVPGRARLPEGISCVQIVAGDGFTFALTDQGAIYGWGQFKDDLSSFYSFSPDTKVQRLPALVYQPEDVRDRVRKLAAGARHMVALTRRGTVLTWGIAGQGQLGRVEPFNNEAYPPATVLLKPTAVPGIAAAIGPEVADIGAGNYTTFAISRRGAVAAWGLNNGGQLGLPIAADKEAEQCVWKSTAVPSLSKGIQAVSGGEHHSLALTKQHKVLSFGSSNYGMLGRVDIPKPVDKETICLPDPAPVDSTDGLAEEQAVSIAAGMHVSACVTKSGQAFTWGSNVNYQMAKGQDEDDNEVPMRMRRHKAFGNRKVLQFSFGGQHAALLASEEQPAEGAAAAAAAPAAAAPSAAAPAAADGAGTSAAAEAAAEPSAAAAAAAEEPAAEEPAAEEPAAAAKEPTALEEEPAAAEEGAGESEVPSKGKRARKGAAAAAKEKVPAAKKRKT